mgnify:CR=1 FL=1
MEFCIKGLNKPYSFLNSCYKTYSTLAISLKSLTFATCFHSIRFKVNKGWSSAELLFYAPNLNNVSSI